MPANKQAVLLSNPLTAFSQFGHPSNYFILGIPKEIYHYNSSNYYRQVPWISHQAEPIFYNTHKSPAKYSQKNMIVSDTKTNKKIRNNPIQRVFFAEAQILYFSIFLFFQHTGSFWVSSCKERREFTVTKILVLGV